MTHRMRRDQIDVTEKVKDATLGLGRAVVRRMCFFLFNLQAGTNM